MLALVKRTRWNSTTILCKHRSQGSCYPVRRPTNDARPGCPPFFLTQSYNLLLVPYGFFRFFNAMPSLSELSVALFKRNYVLLTDPRPILEMGCFNPVASISPFVGITYTSVRSLSHRSMCTPTAQDSRFDRVKYGAVDLRRKKYTLDHYAA